MDPPTTSSTSTPPSSAKEEEEKKKEKKKKRLQLSNSLSGRRGKGTTKAELEELHAAITAQASHVRTLKSQQGSGEAWRKNAVMVEIQKLLELKYTYCALSPTPVDDPQLFVESEPAHVIKVRWEVRKPDGTVVRLQVPFHDVVHVTGQDVIDIIRTHTAKPNHFPKSNGFVKVEIPEPVVIVSAAGVGAGAAVVPSSSSSSSSSSSPSAKEKQATTQWRAVLPEDKFYLPLRFPGPVLEKLWVFEFRVTFPERTTHLTIPPAYHALDKLPEILDMGVNLFSSPLCDDANQVVSRAFGAGVSQLLLITTNLKNSEWSVEQCSKRERSMYSTVGVHPYKASSSPLEDLTKLKELAKKPFCVAIGECGLDLPKAEKIVKSSKERAEKAKADTATPTTEEKGSTPAAASKPVANIFDVEEVMQMQEKWFEAQIELALEINKPLFFHERGCVKRFLGLVSKYADRIQGRAVINCFTGTTEDLRAYLDLGFHIAITGFLCNEARGTDLREVVKHIPLDKLLISSDAPHLIPFTMPKPYPKENEPAFLAHVLVTVAECMRRPIHEVAAATTANARKLFGLPSLPFDGSLGGTPLPDLNRSPNAMIAIASVTHDTVKNVAAGAKAEAEAEAVAMAEPEPVSEEKFHYAGKIYYCSTKEKTILEKQQKLVDEAAFKELLSDFDLPFREEPKPKAAKGKPRKARPSGAGRGRGRGRRGRGRGRR